MKKTKLILIALSALFLMIGGVGCKKEDILPSNQAKGKILFITGPCEGGMVYIEVNNPKGLGKEGIYIIDRFLPTAEVIEYENVISVPLFSRINLPLELMKKDTWLHFEYREVTEEDIRLFYWDKICPYNLIPPPKQILHNNKNYCTQTLKPGSMSGFMNQ